MHFGIEVVTLGDYADPRNVLELAQAAEQAGWEGLFVWDHLGYVWGAPAGDPFIILTAVAARTQRLKLCTSVSPLPRYRPQVLALMIAGLDQLSEGRVIFGAGLGGVPEEFTAFGEPGEPRERAAMLDEGLQVLDGLLRGEQVNHQGRYYTAQGVTLAPLPLQKPRPPIWTGGESLPALRRAARWDGWIAGGATQDGKMAKTPIDVSGMLSVIEEVRGSLDGFEVALTGYTEPGDCTRPESFAQVGVTWWLESLHGFRGSRQEMLERVNAGPPV